MKRLTDDLLLIGSPGDSSDVRYASGFNAVDPMVFLQHRKKVFLVVPLLELGRAKRESPGAHVLTPQELPIAQEKRRRVSDWALGLLKHLGVKRVRVAPTFPSGSLRYLEAAGIRVAIDDQPPFPQRAVKAKSEVAKIESSQRAAVAAMNAGIALIRRARVNGAGFLTHNGKKLTSEDVRFVVDVELLKNGCMARDTIIAGGRQAADPHDRGRGPLRAGQTIVLDIFPQNKTHGYWGDITRTVIKGPASAKQRAMYRAVHEAQTVALSLVKPGVVVRRIHQAVQDVFKRWDFPTEIKNGVARGFFHGTGHGVGLDIHEAPSVGLSDVRLRTGQVITVEPGLYYPEHGGVRIEDTVVVTRRGYEFLATCPKTFELK